MAETVKYTIYRDSWLRGEEGQGTLWRPTDNRMCCIGQIGYQAGLPLPELRCAGSLSDLGYIRREHCPMSLRGLIKVEGEYDEEADTDVTAKDTALAEEAMTTNDAESFLENDREAIITKLMLKAGIELTFVDGVAPWFTEAPAN